jgi:hypothetical protein
MLERLIGRSSPEAPTDDRDPHLQRLATLEAEQTAAAAAYEQAVAAVAAALRYAREIVEKHGYWQAGGAQAAVKASDDRLAAADRRAQQANAAVTNFRAEHRGFFDELAEGAWVDYRAARAEQRAATRRALLAEDLAALGIGPPAPVEG